MLNSVLIIIFREGTNATAQVCRENAELHNKGRSIRDLDRPGSGHPHSHDELAEEQQDAYTKQRLQVRVVIVAYSLVKNADEILIIVEKKNLLT